MNLSHVEPIADAILYEGYLLYPYRFNSLKNRERWTFGVLYPRAYSETRGGLEPWNLQCECLLVGSEATEVEVVLRFLHPVFHLGTQPSAAQEAHPVRIDMGALRLGDLSTAVRRTFSSASDELAERDDAAGVRRLRETISGTVEIAATPVGGGAFKLTVHAGNLTPLAEHERGERGPAQRRIMASAHVVLGARSGSFASLLDPPPILKEAAESCVNRGVWPVLVGAPGRQDTVLASPIILDDYPAVAPESPGDLFDGTEIDEILTLRILTLTDEERALMAGTDERIRELLSRTEALAPDQLARLHGAMRRGSVSERPRKILVDGRPLGVGHRVRLRPFARRDIMDLALAGRSATIVSVEQDYEDRVYFTVTVDDDPGRDLGVEGKPGHRFFFEPGEVEPLPLTGS